MLRTCHKRKRLNKSKPPRSGGRPRGSGHAAHPRGRERSGPVGPHVRVYTPVWCGCVSTKMQGGPLPLREREGRFVLFCLFASDGWLLVVPLVGSVGRRRARVCTTHPPPTPPLEPVLNAPHPCACPLACRATHTRRHPPSGSPWPTRLPLSHCRWQPRRPRHPPPPPPPPPLPLPPCRPARMPGSPCASPRCRCGVLPPLPPPPATSCSMSSSTRPPSSGACAWKAWLRCVAGRARGVRVRVRVVCGGVWCVAACCVGVACAWCCVVLCGVVWCCVWCVAWRGVRVAWRGVCVWCVAACCVAACCVWCGVVCVLRGVVRGVMLRVAWRGAVALCVVCRGAWGGVAWRGVACVWSRCDLCDGMCAVCMLCVFAHPGLTRCVSVLHVLCCVLPPNRVCACVSHAARCPTRLYPAALPRAALPSPPTLPPTATHRHPPPPTATHRHPRHRRTTAQSLR